MNNARPSYSTGSNGVLYLAFEVVSTRDRSGALPTEHVRRVTDLDSLNPSDGIYCVRARRHFQTGLSVGSRPVVQNAASVTFRGGRNH